MMRVNAQGNYDQGRGADGLGLVMPASRYGAGVPYSDRPAAISGKPRPPASLDPQLILPRLYGGRDIERIPLVSKKPLRGLIGGPEWRAPQTPGPGLRTWVSGRSGTATRRRRRPISKAQTIRHRKQFVGWLKNWSPRLYAVAKAKADAAEVNDGTLGQLAGWWESFTQGITDVGGQYIQFRTQKEILDAQMERMRAGEPPLQTSEYAPTVSVKVDPGTTAEITGAIGTGLGKMLPFIAIGGLALLFLMRR